MIDAKKITVLLQLDHISGQHGVGRIVLVADRAVELLFEMDTLGRYRKTMLSANLNEIFTSRKPYQANPQQELGEVPTNVNENNGSILKSTPVSKNPTIVPVNFLNTSIPLAHVMGCEATNHL